MLRGKNTKNSESIYKRSIVSRFLEVFEISPLIVLILLSLIFTLADRFFISTANFRVILSSASFTGIISIGMALVFITGQFDLSAGGVAGFCAMVAAVFMTILSLPVWLSLLAAFLIAVLIGLINGFLTVKLKIPPLVATLGMMFILKGGTMALTGGYSIYPLPESFNNLGRAKFFGLPWGVAIFIVLIFILDFILRKTTFGRKVYATGANILVAKLMGINTDLVKIITYVTVSILAALSGILFMLNIRTGSPEIAGTWILLIVAGVVIGGVSTFGGYGTILGTVIGSLVVWFIRSGLTMIGARAEWQTASIGIILILSTIFDSIRRRSKLSD